MKKKKSRYFHGDRLALNFLVVAAWLGCTVVISIPSSIFLANRGEFTIQTAHLFMFTMPLFVAGLGLATIIYAVLPRVTRPYAVATLFALAGLVWLQGNILVWDYGPLDGRSISWSDNRSRGFIDTAVWLTVLTLSFVIPKNLLKVSLTFSMVIIAFSLSMMGFGLLRQYDTSDVASIRDFQIEESNKFVYSSEKNVILIVLDAFQSDVFAQVVKDKEYSQVFDGFTYFPDAVGASYYTQLAIPALLTGEIYDNSLPRSDFLRGSFLKFGITTLLLRASFAVDLYPWVGWGNETIYFDQAVASNLKLKTLSDSKERIYSERNAKEVLRLIDLSLFRSAPHFAKRFIFNDQKWFTIQIARALAPTSVKQSILGDREYLANVFAKNALEMTALGSPEATFKYYHLKGAHRPLTVDPNLSFSDFNLPFTRQNYILSVKANIKAIGEYLDNLKAKDIFDNSLIIIVGDHGSGNIPEVYIEPGEIGERIPGTKRNFQKDKARGVPLVLIKRVDASAPMTINKAPVSLSDIPATILSELEIEGPSVGRSVFEVVPGEARTRTFSAFDYVSTHNDYVSPMTVYEINGNSWRDSSWSVKEVRHPQDSE
jgi:hypothetical protein